MIFKKILMCKPKYFDVVHYKLNSHMLMQRDVNIGKSMTQWVSLKHKLDDCLVDLKFVKPKKNLVDMVFAANGGLVYKNKALVANFSAIPRQPESKYYYKFFDKYGFDTYNLKTNFEGAGDGLFSHNHQNLWLGYGFRSDLDARTEVSDIISDPNLNIHSLKLEKENFYHLDTCFCPIGHNHVLIYPKAFDTENLYKIYDVFGERNCIKVSDEDANNFACNSICVEKNIEGINYITIIGNKFSEQLKNTLYYLDYEVIENDMSEFLLSGGSTKCCILSIDSGFGNRMFDVDNIVDENYYEMREMRTYRYNDI
jgi:N-dimethylarginine dimethylaminohydrolase